jgi:GTPase SAR1 family protein
MNFVPIFSCTLNTVWKVDWQIVLGVTSVLLGIATVWLTRKNKEAQDALHQAQGALYASVAAKEQMQLTVAKLEKVIEAHRGWARGVGQLEYVYQDIVLFGPRNSGKTSVAELWTKPWVDIDGMPHTEDWEVRETSLFSINKVSRRDPLFEVDRTYESELRVRIHDYPGEDSFRRKAVKRLPSLTSKAVVLLFFDIEAAGGEAVQTTRNNSYYSKAFFDSIERESGLSSSLAKAIVVFNKIDLLAPSENLDHARATLRKINSDADRRINSLFSGMLEYHFVSATTNQGLISLLGSAASAGLPVEAQNRFEQHLEKLYAKATRGIDTPPDGGPPK